MLFAELVPRYLTPRVVVRGVDESSEDGGDHERETEGIRKGSRDGGRGGGWRLAEEERGLGDQEGMMEDG